MPSVTLHLVLADRVLERWLDAPHRAPFDPHNATFLNAFYQGAIGPDLGYFPGGYKLLSELSHLVRSGELTKILVRSARTPLERAFSWGWVTHVLADQAIHPLVGRAVGEFLYGERDFFADGALHQAAHVQVETGLDAFYSHLFPEIRHRRMAPVFDGVSISFLGEAYRRVYALGLDPSVLLASHLATTRMSAQGLLTIGVLSTALMARPVCPTFVGTRWFIQAALALMRVGMRRDSLLLAFLSPTPPATWFLEEVGKEVESFSERFLHHYEGGLSELANYNLDTGSVQEDPPSHLGTLRALRALKEEGGLTLPNPRTSALHSGQTFPTPTGTYD